MRFMSENFNTGLNVNTFCRNNPPPLLLAELFDMLKNGPLNMSLEF